MTLLLTPCSPIYLAQEGSWVSTGTQGRVLGFLRQELDGRGLKATEIAASDWCRYSQAVAALKAPPLRNNASVRIINRINVHGYEQKGPRGQLAKEAASLRKRLWSTE